MSVKPALVALALMTIPALAGCLDALGPYVNGPVTPEDLLTDTPSKWIIEVDYVQGNAPDDSALALLHDRLQALSRKDTIAIQVDDELPPRGGAWTTSAITALKDRYQDSTSRGDQVVTWVVYLDGHSDADTSNGKVLGAAYSDHETLAMYKDSIQSAAEPSLSNPFPAYSAKEIERAVIVHEFGHIIGLVNNGLPMQTDHEASECNNRSDAHHSDNRASVMYCAVETSDLIQAFTGGLPTTFDADDKADVCAAGGRC